MPLGNTNPKPIYRRYLVNCAPKSQTTAYVFWQLWKLAAYLKRGVNGLRYLLSSPSRHWYIDGSNTDKHMWDILRRRKAHCYRPMVLDKVGVHLINLFVCVSSVFNLSPVGLWFHTLSLMFSICSRLLNMPGLIWFYAWRSYVICVSCVASVRKGDKLSSYFVSLTNTCIPRGPSKLLSCERWTFDLELIILITLKQMFHLQWPVKGCCQWCINLT